MKTAIERVVAELETKQLEADHFYNAAKTMDVKLYHDGKGDGIELALHMLKEVLATADNNPRNPAEPERDGQ